MNTGDIALRRITGMKNDNCRKLSWKVDSNKFLPEVSFSSFVPNRLRNPETECTWVRVILMTSLL